MAITLGVVMVSLGVFIALRPLAGASPITGSRAFDVAFAALFVLRGGMNVQSARRIGRTAREQAGADR